MTRKRMTTVFRNLMEQDGLIVAPGAYDALSARIIESQGFDAVYVTGSGTAAALLAKLDMGFTTMTELTNHGHRIASAVKIPVIHDSETGFGNAIIATRTMEEWIYSGVAGIHVEDQLTCRYQSPNWEEIGGHTREVVPIETAAGKISAMAEVRDEIDPDFVIIGRTDADNLGYNEVVKRCNAYLKAGADMAMPIPRGLFRSKSKEECIEIFRQLVKDIKGPVFGIGQDSYGLTVKDVDEMGYKLYATPIMTIAAAARAIRDVVSEMKTKGTPKDYFEKFPRIPNDEQQKMLGSERYMKIEKKHWRPDT